MFQARNRETINSTWKVAVSFKIIMTTSVTRPCFTTQHQTCKTKTRTMQDRFFWSQTCLVKTDGLRPHHCYRPQAIRELNRLRYIFFVWTHYNLKGVIRQCDPVMSWTLDKSHAKSKSTGPRTMSDHSTKYHSDLMSSVWVMWLTDNKQTDRQTDRQTDMQTDTGENMTSFIVGNGGRMWDFGYTNVGWVWPTEHRGLCWIEK